MKITQRSGIIILLTLLSLNSFSQKIDFSGAKILCTEKNDKVIRKAVLVLQEEIQKRSGLHLPEIKNWPARVEPLIVAGTESDISKFPAVCGSLLSEMKPAAPEGYRIAVMNDRSAVLVIGKDARGVLYGVGKLLRKMEINPGQVLVPADLRISSFPAYPIRGHQLGYRPKTNAYDAWTPEQFDHYIRDLAIFGANSIEIMPPRTDDDFTSIHMKLPAIKMIAEQSRICDGYGMDVWMWYPNLGPDYSNPDSVKREIKEREEVFRSVPRLNALFVPGGDPGELEPDELFGWLGKVAEVLHKYHPGAKIWVSPQVFKPSAGWYNKFYAHVNREYDWFGGVVYGPWIRTPLPEVKKLIKPAIPIRLYPDITHSLSCQYPFPDWDIALAMTLGRECINPRPEDEKYIHNLYAHLAQGSISYSEGTNDDVNKFVWSDQDWDPEIPVIETLRDYARYFLGSAFSETVAQGLLALERNMRGPLLTNENVEHTFQQWQALEKNAVRTVLSNPRFQSGLIRAYFDAYTRRRFVYETSLELHARNFLENAGKTGSQNAVSSARNMLLKAHEQPVSPELKEKCFALADSLYHSFGAQLTVSKHHAMSGRGNFMDNIDVPLNDALWLLDQLSEVDKLNDEASRLKAIDKILHRTDPGPGGFYDNFGNPAAWKRIKANKTWKEDPGSLESPRVSFGVGLTGTEWVHEVVAKGFGGQTTPLAWMNQVNTLYDTPLVMEYDNLDPDAEYTLRIAYTGRFRSNMKLMADGFMVHDYIRMGTKPLWEFPLSRDITKNGKVQFTWSCGNDDKGGGERGSQVAEIWLIKK